MSNQTTLTSTDWGILRSLLQEGASPTTWLKLSDWLIHNPTALTDEGALGYMHQMLGRWSDTLREVTDPWLGLLFVGQTSPYFELCRRLRFTHLTNFEAHYRVRQTLDHPLIQQNKTDPTYQLFLAQGPHVGWIERLVEHPQLEHITRLDFSYCGEDYDEERWWNIVDLNTMPTQAFDWEHLEYLLTSPRLEQIRHLSFEQMNLFADHIDVFVTNPTRCAQLKSVSFDECYLNLQVYLPIFEQIQWTHLTHMSWSGNIYALADLGHLLTLDTLPALTHLALQRNCATGPFKIPRPFVGNPNSVLRSLDLSNNKWTAEQLLWLSQCSFPPTFDTLRLKRCHLTLASLEVLCKATWFKQLQTLDLSFNDTTLDAHKALALLENNHKPEHLALSSKTDVLPKEIDQPTQAPTHLERPQDGQSWWSWRHGESSFASKEVVHWWPDRPVSASKSDDIVYRIHQNRFETPSFRSSPEPLDGMISVGTSKRAEDMCQAFIKRFASEHGETLHTLTWHDVTDEEEQPSWIENSSVTALLHAFPNLNFFGVKGGYGLRFDALNHPNLKALTIITGGMRKDIIDDLNVANLPNLEALELWLGIDEYGLDIGVSDLETILTNRNPDGSKRFPNLKHLGIVNTTLSADLVNRLITSPLLGELETLDLRFGRLCNPALEQLVLTTNTYNLKRLLLDKNNLSAQDLADHLSFHGVQVQWGYQHYNSDMDEWYLEVTE